MHILVLILIASIMIALALWATGVVTLFALTLLPALSGGLAGFAISAQVGDKRNVFAIGFLFALIPLFMFGLFDNFIWRKYLFTCGAVVLVAATIHATSGRPDATRRRRPLAFVLSAASVLICISLAVLIIPDKVVFDRIVHWETFLANDDCARLDAYRAPSCSKNTP